MWARELLTPWHLVIILAIALVVFGPGKLPELGRSLGQSMREFRSAVSGESNEAAASPSGTETPRERSEAAAQSRREGRV